MMNKASYSIDLERYFWRLTYRSGDAFAGAAEPGLGQEISASLRLNILGFTAVPCKIGALVRGVRWRILPTGETGNRYGARARPSLCCPRNGM